MPSSTRQTNYYNACLLLQLGVDVNSKSIEAKRFRVAAVSDLRLVRARWRMENGDGALSLFSYDGPGPLEPDSYLLPEILSGRPV